MINWDSIIGINGMVRRTLDEIRASMFETMNEIDPELDLVARSPQQSFIDTSVASINEFWQMIADLFDSLTPYNANEYFLNQIAALHGLERNQFVRPSVFVTFTGTVGFVINGGGVVSDGVHQYKVLNGGIVNAGGYVTLYCQAMDDGQWAIPENTVNQILFSVYSPNILTCINQNTGSSGADAETTSNFRERVLRNYRKNSLGTATYCKALLQEIPDVDARSVSIKKYLGAVKVMVAGGDPYDVAYAIYKSGLDISRLSGSTVYNQSAARNVRIMIQDYPDFYNILWVNPVEKQIAIHVFWNTNDATFVRDLAIVQVAQPAIVDYINALETGSRINLLELDNIFRDTASAVINPQFISNLRFVVSIDGIVKAADNGTHLISDDPESLFNTTADLITFGRG